MSDEILKQKYRILQSELQLIKNNFNELQDLYEDLVLNTKEGFVVDDKIVFEDSFDKIRTKLNYINQELVNEVIPSVNNKI